MKPKIFLCVLFLLICAGLVVAKGEDPDRTNPISAETETLVPGVLPVTQAFTLAQIRDASGQTVPLLVTGLSGDTITAVDLSRQGASRGMDLLAVVAQSGEGRLTELFHRAKAGGEPELTQEYATGQLLSVAGTSVRNIASGTNFPEHAAETQSQQVFNFPKFGAPTPPVTTVEKHEDVLLDYEVELCMRFDRDVRTVQDFDAARKGVFLCGDFTDRAVLSRLINVDNFDSGSGFSDAKSGPDFFPTGGLLVVPHDWESFVDAERITTLRNELRRQDGRGGEMILDFRQLTEQVLADATSTRFIYEGQRQLLIADGRIAQGQILMSGTPEGVIFMPPTTRQMIRGIARYLITGAFLSGTSGYDSVVASFIREELKSGRYLQPGEEITYHSSSMGTVKISVVAADLPGG